MRIAYAWLGTPYVIGASECRIASDCVGMIEGIARDLGLACPSRSALTHDLVAAAQQFFLPCEEGRPGCVILLAQSPGATPVHAGLLSANGRFIHAHWTAGVVENRYGNWFRVRTTHVFDWPARPSPIQEGMC